MTDNTEALPPLPDFEQWWREHFTEATAQDESFAEAERCARVVWSAALAQRQQVPLEPLSRSEVDSIFEAHADAPTMSFRYYVTEAIEKALLQRLAATPALTAAPSAQAEPQEPLTPMSEQQVAELIRQLGFAQLSPTEVIRAYEAARGIGKQEGK